MSSKLDIIAAIATAPGRGGIGVVRISGSDLKLFSISLLGQSLIPRHATYLPFLDADGITIDHGIALFFPAPHSYTGEDVLELQGHGGPAVLQLIFLRCLELGARLAEPGEFTRRAYLNEKLDLAQAEAVADLINATTIQAARSATRSLQGEFSDVVRQLLAELINLRMRIEATIDFPEESVDPTDSSQITEQLAGLKVQLSKIFAQAKQGSLLREGAHIVLLGEPNVGKSSLLNLLSGEEVALVSNIPGTTRDAIRQALQINGVPLHIIDTAGLRISEDPIEQMGMERSRNAAEKADAVLWLMDAQDPSTYSSMPQNIPPGTPKLYVFNKIDLTGGEPRVEIHNGERFLYLSAKTGAGVELLRTELLNMIGWHQEGGVFMARQRHIQALMNTEQHLCQAEHEQSRLEVMAEELRHAQTALNQITGEFTADDLLGEIFGRFCIGK